MNRRDVLTVGGGLTLSTTLAGCFSVEQHESEGQTADNESTASNNETEATDDSELDLREANVVGVEFEERDGAYRFAVSLHHDDAGEEGYADWWQVETLDGTQLGRRDLLHAHENNQPFERSETIEVPDNVPCVVVRGHDQTHGYGGRAVVVTLDAAGQNVIQQGSERQPISESDCPA
jgi:hypothetical protein